MEPKPGKVTEEEAKRRIKLHPGDDVDKVISHEALEVGHVLIGHFEEDGAVVDQELFPVTLLPVKP